MSEGIWGSTPVDDFFNQLVDSGKLFFLQTRTRASSTPRVFRIRTGARSLNVTITISAGLASTIDVMESPTISSPGTAVVLRNYNRNYADDGLLSKVYAGGTVTGGTNISPNQSGFGTNAGQAQSGLSSQTIKYKWKPNTEYSVTVTPDATTDTTSRSIAWED